MSILFRHRSIVGPLKYWVTNEGASTFSSTRLRAGDQGISPRTCALWLRSEVVPAGSCRQGAISAADPTIEEARRRFSCRHRFAAVVAAPLWERRIGTHVVGGISSYGVRKVAYCAGLPLSRFYRLRLVRCSAVLKTVETDGDCVEREGE